VVKNEGEKWGGGDKGMKRRKDEETKRQRDGETKGLSDMENSSILSLVEAPCLKDMGDLDNLQPRRGDLFVQQIVNIHIFIPGKLVII